MTGFDKSAPFARELGIESAAYGKYERGESAPPLDVLERIVDITAVDLNWLLLGRGQPDADPAHPLGKTEEKTDS